MLLSGPIFARRGRPCLAALFALLAVLAAPAINALHIHDDESAHALVGEVDHHHEDACPTEDVPSGHDHKRTHDPSHCATCSVITAFASAATALGDAPLAIFEHRTHWLRPTDVAAPVPSHPHLTCAAPRGPPAVHA